MSILITGSSGHLGEGIARTLQQQQIPYTGLDIKAAPYTTQVGSLTDAALLDEVMEGVEFVIHTASLHKPHVATHTKQDFINTNITGTLNLLEAATRHQVKAFIYTSTTSTFGDMLTPEPGEPAIWITEKTPCIPKNIYGVTKRAAEDLCQLFSRNHQLPCIILKTSRFFPEDDDKKQVRALYSDLNAKANEYLYRRVDIEDAVSAHLLAMEHAEKIGFGTYIISATSPFQQADLRQLNSDAISVVKEIYPDFHQLYAAGNWKMFPHIDRVYVNESARRELGWTPKYDFQYVLDCLATNRDFRSPLSLAIGKKGYHAEGFSEGPYPVREDL